MYLLVDAEIKRRGDEHKLRITQAWYTGYFQRVQKFPRLESVLRERAQQKKITDPKQMLEWAKSFASMYGTVKKRGAETNPS